MSYYFTIVIMIACAVLYYRVGIIEYGKGWLLAVVSVVLSIITTFVLGWGWLPTVGAQAGIFVVLTILNMCRKKGMK